MERCYPTGCNPCDAPIDFPENPKDGQRFCITVGKDGNNTTKCWVYDSCVPAWRAEGPNASPTRFRGALDPTQSPLANGITDTPEDQWTGNPPRPPATDAAAGDWWVVTVAAPNGPHPGFNNDLQGVAIAVGDRIFYDGDAYDRMPPPVVPYAEEALGDVALDDEGKPDPDERVGGIVKNATLSQAIAGTDRCDTITPYTLQGKLDNDLVDFTPTKPADDGVSVVIDQGDTYAFCVVESTLRLTATATATTEAGIPAIGRFTYQWFETTGGTDTPLQITRNEVVSGAGTDQLRISMFDITPATGTRTFKIKATYIDLFNEEYEAEDTVTVSLAQGILIDTDPTPIDLSTTTTGTSSVAVTQVNTGLADATATYQWRVNGAVIEGATTPDLGYTWADWDTDTLSITRTSDTATTLNIDVVVGGGCNGSVFSLPTQLIGPGPGGQSQPTPPPPPAPVYWQGVVYACGSSTGIPVVGTTLTYKGDTGCSGTAAAIANRFDLYNQNPITLPGAVGSLWYVVSVTYNGTTPGGAQFGGRYDEYITLLRSA